MKLTIADLVVLSVLVRAGPMHGYELWQRLEDADVADWARVSRPQVYYSLRKLAGTAYLERADQGEASRGPERTTYRATDKAADGLRQALGADHWTERPPPAPFVTWAALALNAEASTVRHQIQRYRARMTAEIERENSTLMELEAAPGRDAAVGRALVKMAIGQLTANLASLEALEAALTEIDELPEELGKTRD
ncbi:MAG: PadR family transcriptional regulator [Parvularcula sp.]|jgi:DNA-binding PadR family transcriptional regulator|nr:PadR family transcriptional regulator [Parvularcula sp.]